MPKPLPYLFGFFGLLVGLATLLAVPVLLNLNVFGWLNYGFVLITCYLAALVIPLHLLALVFYLGRYLLARRRQWAQPRQATLRLPKPRHQE